MQPKSLTFDLVGCCHNDSRAMVDLGNGDQAIVTNNGDGTYAVVKIRDGLMVPSSAKTIGPDDEI